MKVLALVLVPMLAACALPSARPCVRETHVVWCAFAKCDVKQAPAEPIKPQECKTMLTPDPGSAANVARIVALLTELYQPEEAALWLRSPLASLDDKRPLDLLGDDAGEARLIDVLTREHERHR
jgi:hypothetical protein